MIFSIIHGGVSEVWEVNTFQNNVQSDPNRPVDPDPVFEEMWPLQDKLHLTVPLMSVENLVSLVTNKKRTYPDTVAFQLDVARLALENQPLDPAEEVLRLNALATESVDGNI